MKIASGISVVALVIAGCYYFLFHPYEFKVNFSSATLPGDVIQTLRMWDRTVDSSKIIRVDSFSHVRQHIIVKGHEYFYDWYFQLEDSTTQVSVHMTEPLHSLHNKWLMIFGDPPIKIEGTALVTTFYSILKQHLELTSVKIIGEEKREREFCICRSIDVSQLSKAQGMMENYLPISTSILGNGLKPAGLPSVRITQWSHSLNKLKYDFCFPIIETDSLPLIDGLKYKHFNSFYALKAEYHGNYITSDRAWYELYRKAATDGYKITGLPVEYFFDNPNFGSNEKNWKAEIFLQIENN